MKNTLRKTLMTCAVSAVCAFSANVASAQTALFADFTVDPSGPAANFVADKVTGNYVEIANFNSDGTFTANLYWKAAAFVAADGTNQLNSDVTGLGSDYGMYALYSANGTFTTSGAQTNFNFTPGTGSLSLWLDPTNDTDYMAGSGDNFIGTNEGEDIRLANGMPESGNGYLDPSNPQCTAGIFCGAFGSTTSFQLTDPDGTGFFVSPSPFYTLSFQSGQLNNFNPAGRQVLNGSLDVTFNGGSNPVPEPASIALLGLGLVGLGLARRRSRKA